MGAIAAQLWLFKYLLLLSSTPLHKGAYHAVREDDQVIVKVVRLSPSCERVAKYEGSEGLHVIVHPLQDNNVTLLVWREHTPHSYPAGRLSLG